MKDKVFSVISIILSVVSFCFGLVAFLFASIDTLEAPVDSVLAGAGFTSEQIANINHVVADDDLSNDAFKILKDELEPEKVQEILTQLTDNKNNVKKVKKIKKDTITEVYNQAKAGSKRTFCYTYALIGIGIGIAAIVLIKFCGRSKGRAISLSNLAKIGMLVEVIVIAMFLIAQLKSGAGI